jgi:endonuclease-3
MKPKSVEPVMKTLSKKYISTEKTTLNRMRKKPDAYKILISCLLSLRARDETTDVISEQLFKVANTPKKIINLPLPKLKKIIFKSGHYNKKRFKRINKKIQRKSSRHL